MYIYIYMKTTCPCSYMYIYISGYFCVYAYVCPHIGMYKVYIHLPTCTYTCIYIYTRIHTNKQTNKHTYIHTYMHPCMHTYIHTRIHIQKDMHVYRLLHTCRFFNKWMYSSVYMCTHDRTLSTCFLCTKDTAGLPRGFRHIIVEELGPKTHHMYCVTALVVRQQ